MAVERIAFDSFVGAYPLASTAAFVADVDPLRIACFASLVERSCCASLGLAFDRCLSYRPSPGMNVDGVDDVDVGDDVDGVVCGAAFCVRLVSMSVWRASIVPFQLFSALASL